MRSCQRSSECSLWRERKTIAILNGGNNLIPNASVLEKFEPCAQAEVVLESELHELGGVVDGQIGANAGFRFDALGGLLFDEQGNASWQRVSEVGECARLLQSLDFGKLTHETGG